MLGITHSLIREHCTIDFLIITLCFIFLYNSSYSLASALKLSGHIFSYVFFNISFFEYRSTMSVFYKLNLKITTRFPDFLSSTESGFHGDSRMSKYHSAQNFCISFFSYVLKVNVKAIEWHQKHISYMNIHHKRAWFMLKFYVL